MKANEDELDDFISEWKDIVEVSVQRYVPPPK